jgi:hypothetical protein
VKLAALLIGVALAAGAGAAAAAANPVPLSVCMPAISGARTCLEQRARCSAADDRQYERYGYVCVDLDSKHRLARIVTEPALRPANSALARHR